MRGKQSLWRKQRILSRALRAAAVILGVAVLVGFAVEGAQLGLRLRGGDAAGGIAAGGIAALVGVAVAALVVALLLGRRARGELARSQNLSQLELLLRLDEHFRTGEYFDIERKLEDGGAWADGWVRGGDPGPETEDDWRRLTEYVRGFEPVYLLAREGVSVELIRTTFGHRIDQLVRNKKVVGRIVGKQQELPWVHFLELWRLVDQDGYDHWSQFVRLWQVVDTDTYERPAYSKRQWTA